MSQVELVVKLTIEAHLFDVTLLVADTWSLDEEELPVGQGELAGGNVRSTEDILVAAWADRIEAHRREDIPC